jgi:hypothetical protein
MNDDNKQPFTSQQKKELEETIRRAVYGPPRPKDEGIWAEVNELFFCGWVLMVLAGIAYYNWFN